MPGCRSASAEHRFPVGDVGLEEGEALVLAQRLQPRELQHRVVVVAEIVDAEDLLAPRQQCPRDVRADEAGGTGDKNGHGDWGREEDDCGAADYNVSPSKRNLETATALPAGRDVRKTSFLIAPSAIHVERRNILSLPSPYKQSGSVPMAQIGNPGRQIPSRKRPDLPDRHPGAGAPADDAAPARPGRRPQYRRLHLRLSRLAARRLRPGAVAGQALHQEQPHRVPARRQRGPRGDRPVGHPADPSLSRRQVRWRVRHVVRQGAGRRPLGRRPQARQLRRHVEARRRGGAGRRRPHGQVVDRGAPERARLHRRRHPGHPSPRRSRSISTSACTPSPCRATRACGSASRC